MQYLSRIFGSSVLLLASVATAGDYGTITLGPLGDGRPGPHMGSGGRFDWDVVSTTSTLAFQLVDSPFDQPPAGPSGDGLNDIYSFCIELVAGISIGTYDVDALTTHVTSARASRLELLGDNYWDDAVGNTNTEAGAFQLAAWEIALGTNGTSLSFVPNALTGSFTAAAQALANTWLSTLDSQAKDGTLRLVWLDRDPSQDQITQVAIPEATSVLVWSMVCGVIGLAVYRRA